MKTGWALIAAGVMSLQMTVNAMAQTDAVVSLMEKVFPLAQRGFNAEVIKVTSEVLDSRSSSAAERVFAASERSGARCNLGEVQACWLDARAAVDGAEKLTGDKAIGKWLLTGALVALVNAHEAQGSSDAALATANRLVAHSGSWQDRRAQLHAAARDYPSALADLRTVMTSAKDDFGRANARFNIALVQIAAGNPDGARAEAAEIGKLLPKDASSPGPQRARMVPLRLMRGAIFATLGDISAAARELADAHADDPGEPIVQMLRAFTLASTGDYKNGSAMADLIVPQMANSSRHAALLAILSARARDASSATLTLPTDAERLTWSQSLRFYVAGRLTREELLTTAVHGNPAVARERTCDALLVMGQAAAWRGDRDAARRDLGAHVERCAPKSSGGFVSPYFWAWSRGELARL
jgi:tetratricopeptide (TPR) repeat protein